MGDRDFFNDSVLIRVVSYGPLLFIPLVVISITYFIFSLNELRYKESLKNLQDSYISAERYKVISKVNSAVKLIEYKMSIAENMLKEKVKNRVDVAYSVAKNLYIQNKSTHTDKDIQKLIIDSLRPLSWNNAESYIFIVNFDGIISLAPQYLKHLEGKSIIDFQDAAKSYVIRKEIALAKSAGEGYLWDTFTRPNYHKSIHFKQLAYIKKFDDFNWYMGSAEYLDTTMHQTQSEALDILKNAFLKQSNYFFVIDQNGSSIMNGQNIVKNGTNVLSMKDEDGKELVKELIKSANSKEPYFVSYKLNNPVTKRAEEKFSYVKKVPKTEWIVGTGYYMDTISSKIEAKKSELKDAHNKDYKNIVMFSVIIIMISLLVSYYISMKLKEKLLNYSKEIKEKNIKLVTLNLSLEQLVEERTRELKKAYSDMKNIATKDFLTEIYNRYFFNDALKNEIYSANRYNSIFSLCMFDLDHFKDVNDTYGHDVGDMLLKNVCDTVKKYLRENDIFARVGGEEFMIIMPNTSLDAALVLIERLRIIIQQMDFDKVGHITISFGLVSYKEKESKEELLKRVDIALYNAKDSGRNRVIVEK